MCSVSLFTFPPGRRLLIDSWSRSHLFGKFFVSDALSLPCECACVRVCARDALSLLRVCVCVCCGCLIFTNSHGPLPSRNLNNPRACSSCSEHRMSTNGEQIRTGVLASVQNWVSFSCFCVFLCTKTLGSRVPAEHSQVPALSCERERRREERCKETLDQQLPLRAKQRNLIATGCCCIHRQSPTCLMSPKNNNNSSSNCCHSV